MNDLKFAIRQLRNNPGFAAVAAISLALALGIGVNTAILSLVNTTFLRALPCPEPHQLVRLSERNAAGDSIPDSHPNFLDWQKQRSPEFGNGLAIYHNAEGRLKTERMLHV